VVERSLFGLHRRTDIEPEIRPMNGTVEMFRAAVEREGRDRFSCSLAVWELLVEIGQTFGWQPKGTTYLVSPRQKVETPALRNYQPGNALDHKRVETEDAIAWARALEVAKRSPHLAAMMNARSEAIGASDGTAPHLDEFIAFAYGGAFTFAISREPDG
jgi:hypothetical protein